MSSCDLSVWMQPIFWRGWGDRGWFLWGIHWTGTCGSHLYAFSVKASGTRKGYLKFREEGNLRRKVSILLDLRWVSFSCSIFLYCESCSVIVSYYNFLLYFRITIVRWTLLLRHLLFKSQLSNPKMDHLRH